MQTFKRSCVLAVALSALLCAGCDNVAKESDIDTSTALCSNNNGVHTVSGQSDAFNGKVLCNNGASFYFRDGKAIVPSGT